MEFLQNILTNTYFINMSILAISGFFIRSALVMSGQKWANTYHHLLSYIFLPVTGYVITTIIKGDLALSLGMIGALSIVRFRNPVKNPFELVVFFSLLTLGIIASVSMKLLLLFLFFKIVVIFGVKILDLILVKFNINLFQSSFDDGNEIFTMDIDSKKKLENIELYSNLIYFNYDKIENIYNYKFSFKRKSDLIKQKEILLKDENIFNIRADLQR
tara:strand:+ start:93 stop:740 length:648 start_codon:yes stop_codon:yes gene_type:complete